MHYIHIKIKKSAAIYFNCRLFYGSEIVKISVEQF